MNIYMKLQLGKQWVGEDNPCFVIAEAGINHNGSMDNAKKLIDVALQSGANCVKFQKSCLWPIKMVNSHVLIIS